MFKRTTVPIHDPNEVVSAILVPHEHQTDSQVTAWLAKRGVSEVKILANRFLSVRADRQTLSDATAVAQVEIKTQCKPNSRAPE
jgi:methylaspartate ammonia-lyase